MNKRQSEKWVLIIIAISVILAIAISGVLLWSTSKNATSSQHSTTVSVDESVSDEESSQVVSIEMPPPIEVPTFLAKLTAKSQAEPYQGVEGELKLRSVGDVLIHDRVSVLADTQHEIYRQTIEAMQQEGIDIQAIASEYDFMPMVARIAPFTQYADVTIANMEVPTAYPQFPVSGYPQFNAPKSILTALKEVGVDIVTNGTNHTLDLFADGAIASIHNMQEAGLMYVGSYESWEDYRTPRIIEKNGIKLGFLTYSYGTNGIPIPDGQEYIISLVELDTMLQEVEMLKPQVDAVVVTLQLGEEYDTLPNDNQRYVFQALADAGVKLILGGHPHVLQPIEWYNDGKTYAIYSQASFVSGQRELDNKQGGITEVTFKRLDNGEVVVQQPKFMPIFMLGVEAEKMYETVPLADYAKYAIPDGKLWWDNLYERMRTFTTDFDYVNHLETEWTQEDKDIFQ